MCFMVCYMVHAMRSLRIKPYLLYINTVIGLVTIAYAGVVAVIFYTTNHGFKDDDDRADKHDYLTTQSNADTIALTLVRSVQLLLTIVLTAVPLVQLKTQSVARTSFIWEFVKP